MAPRPPPPRRRRPLVLAVVTLLFILLLTGSASASIFGGATKEKEEKKEEAEVGGGRVLSSISDAMEDVADAVEDVVDAVQEARLKVRTRVKQRVADIKDAALELHESISDAVEDAVDDVREYLGIDTVEERLVAVKRRTKFLRRVLLKGAIGAGMLMYGLHFSHLVVFAHTIRVTGWPVITRAWDEAVELYFNARKTIKKEFPNVAKTKELMQAVSFEIDATRKMLKEARKAADDGTVTTAEAKEAIRKAKINLRELNNKSYLINQSLSSMSAVVAAIDVKKIKELLKGVYTSVLACFATISSSTLRGLSIGFDLAALISRHIDHAAAAIVERMPTFTVFKVLPGETRKLLAVALSLVSLVKGLFVVHFVVPKLTLAISSSALGAVWFTDALAEVADARAGGEGQGLLRRDKALYVLSNVGLTFVGVAFQSARAEEEIPRWIRVLLYPALKLEQFLRSLDGAFGIGRDKLHQAIFHHNKKAADKAAPEPPPPRVQRRGLLPFFGGREQPQPPGGAAAAAAAGA